MLVQLNVVYGPTPTPSPSADGGLDSTIIAALIGGLIAVVVAVFGYLQWRRTVAVQRELERERLRAERDRLAHEDQLGRARAVWEEDRRAAAERAAAEEAAVRRLQAAAEHADDLERSAIQYRQSVIDELRALKILDMNRSLDLDTLYVQVRIRQEDQHYLSKRDIEHLAKGDPEDMLRLSAEHATAKAVDAIRPEDALRRYHRLVVVGDPGAGKTTMLKNLAFRAARGELSADLVVPIFVELRDFVDSQMDDVLHFAAQWCERRYGFTHAREYFDQKLIGGHAVLLLDGIDEVLGGASAEEASGVYERVLTEIDRLAVRYPAASIAVSCRRAGWRGGLSAFQVLEVLDFDWEQVQRFLRNWFINDEAKSDGLRAALSNNVRMRTLAANPLILSLIAIVYERDLELPERRAELYRRCTQVLLQEWDAHRGIQRFNRFTTDRKRDLLCDLAWQFHQTGRRYFPEEEVLRLIAQFLPTVGLDAADAEAVLDEIGANYGLLKEQARGLYGFLHLTLQEYFTATAASDRLTTVLPELIRRRHDPWWEEVLLLLAGRIDATPLLLGILGHSTTADSVPTQRPLAVDDDLLHRDLFLAARCLVGTPRVAMPGLREAIVAELWTLLDTSGLMHVTVRAAQLLIALSDSDGRARLVEVAIHGMNYSGIVGALHAIGETTNAEFGSALHANLRSPAEPSPIAIKLTVEGLGLLGYRPARQDLVMLLRRYLDGNQELVSGWVEDRAQGLPLIAEVVNAIGRIGGTGGADELQQVLWQSRHEDYGVVVAQECISALANVGDTQTLHWLLTNLDMPSLMYSRTMVRTCLRLSEPEQRPDILRRLFGTESDGRWVNAESAAAVREFTCPEFVTPLLEIIGGGETAAANRWCAAELLDDFEVAEPSLRAMMVDTGRDRICRAAAASTLATRQHRDGRDFLIDVVSVPDLPSEVNLSRCCDALIACGEEAWVRDMLLDRLTAAFARPDGNTHAWMCSELLARTDISSVADRIRAELERYAPTIPDAKAYLLANLLCAPLVPYALELDRRHGGTYVLMQRIGAVATADQAAMVLAAFMSSQRGLNSSADAIVELSNRHQLRMYADGRVLPLVSEPDQTGRPVASPRQ